MTEGGVVVVDEIKCIYYSWSFKTWQGLGSHYRHRHEWERGCLLCVGGGGPACWSHFL